MILKGAPFFEIFEVTSTYDLEQSFLRGADCWHGMHLIFRDSVYK